MSRRTTWLAAGMLLAIVASGCDGLVSDKTFEGEDGPLPPLPPPRVLQIALAYSGYSDSSPFTDSFPASGLGISGLLNLISAANYPSLVDPGNNFIVASGTNLSSAAYGRVDLFYDLTGIDLNPFHHVQIDVEATGGQSIYSTGCATDMTSGGGFWFNIYRPGANPPWGMSISASYSGIPGSNTHAMGDPVPTGVPLSEFVSTQDPDLGGPKPYLHLSIQSQQSGDNSSNCSAVLIAQVQVQLGP